MPRGDYDDAALVRYLGCPDQLPPMRVDRKTGVLMDGFHHMKFLDHNLGDSKRLPSLGPSKDTPTCPLVSEKRPVVAPVSQFQLQPRLVTELAEILAEILVQDFQSDR